MNESPSQPDLPASQPGPDLLAALAALQQQTRALGRLLQLTLVALVLLGAGVNLYLLKQVRLLNAQLAVERPTVARMSAEFQNRDLPFFRNFGAKLQNYGYAHREFLPVLDRYRSVLEEFLVTMPPVPASGMTPSIPTGSRSGQKSRPQ